MSWESWDLAIDELCGDILTRLATEEPPVDALHAARLLGCELAYDQSQQGRARQKMIEGQPAVLLKPDDRPERLQWATAHELGEIVCLENLRTNRSCSGGVARSISRATCQSVCQPFPASHRLVSGGSAQHGA